MVIVSSPLNFTGIPEYSPPVFVPNATPVFKSTVLLNISPTPPAAPGWPSGPVGPGGPTPPITESVLKTLNHGTILVVEYPPVAESGNGPYGPSGRLLKTDD